MHDTTIRPEIPEDLERSFDSHRSILLWYLLGMCIDSEAASLPPAASTSQQGVRVFKTNLLAHRHLTVSQGAAAPDALAKKSLLYR